MVAVSLVAGGLFLSLKSVSAGSPNLTLLYLGNNNNDSSDSWDHDVTLTSGQQVQLYAEIHNTNVPSTANNVKVKATLPSGTFTDGSSTATLTADNASSVSDSVALHITGGGQLTPVADGIVDGGFTLPSGLNGCNQYIAQVAFLAQVTGPSPTPSPTPTPSPSPTVAPSPSPTPAAGGDNNNNNNNNNDIDIDIDNNQTQTVNVSGGVTTASVPVKQPETGVGVLGMTAMFGAAPLGLALSRYGRGRLMTTRKEEDLAEIANGLVNTRRGKNNQV
ncbi:MAG: hypothetical protein UU05_C0057G0004 [Candidatus Curtissbacteria bacterium GW2011_GWA1_40_47]|nr:MAG: hypothetical protein UU05_C0057G0004 [Candidatus Curtissbacteria bacterium GW2011_GWA1_40_47]